MLTGMTVAVGTTAVDLLSGLDVDRELDVFLRLTGGGQIWLGDAGVTAGDGFQLIDEFQTRLHGDTLWAISGSSASVDVLVVGVK